MSAAEMMLAQKLDTLIAEVRALRQQTQTGNRELLSKPEAAKLLGIDRNRLSALAAAGVVRAVPVGKRDKIPREEIERLAREGIPREPRKPGRPRKATRSVEDAIRALPLPPRPTGAS